MPKILLVAAAAICFSCAHRPVPEDDSEEKQPETLEQKFIHTDIAVSQWLDGVADGLDLFLVGRKVTEAKGESNVKIENSTYSSEGKAVTNVTSFSVSPRLPNLEKFWQLKFTSYDELQDSRSINNNYLRQTPRERNYGATVGLFQKFGNIRTAFQPRIELQDPLKVSHSLSFQSVADFKWFQFNPKFEFFADATKGAGIYQAYNINFNINKIYSLQLINEGEYDERIHKLTTSNGFSVGQYISPKSAMNYSLVFNANNRPSYILDSYSFAVSWNQLIYKKILDYQITPHLDFPYVTSFKGAAGLVFSINLTL